MLCPNIKPRLRVSLHLHILPPAQRLLWPKLAAIPEPFVLYGGTAIALQLGHRHSIDFDFFARSEFDPQRLLQQNPVFANAEVVAMAANTLTVRFGETEPVLLSCFGVPRLPELRPPLRLIEPRIALGDLLELGGMKAMVVQKRAEAKDYLDIHALIYQAGLELPLLLAAGAYLYPPHFAPELTLKALCYFADGNLASLTSEVRNDLARAVRSVDIQKLPQL